MTHEEAARLWMEAERLAIRAEAEAGAEQGPDEPRLREQAAGRRRAADEAFQQMMQVLHPGGVMPPGRP